MQISVEKTIEREIDGVPTVELPVINKTDEIVESDDPRSSGESHIV